MFVGVMKTKPVHSPISAQRYRGCDAAEVTQSAVTFHQTKFYFGRRIRDLVLAKLHLEAAAPGFEPAHSTFPDKTALVALCGRTFTEFDQDGLKCVSAASIALAGSKHAFGRSR